MGQGASSETGPKGPVGPMGPVGPTGPAGPTGLKSTWGDFSETEKNAFVARFTNDTAYRAVVVDEMTKNAVFAKSMKDAMTTDPVLRTAILAALKADITFTTSLKGAKGDKGDSGGITDENKKNLIWCADGVCRPYGKDDTFVVGAGITAGVSLTNTWKDGGQKDSSEISNDTGTYKQLMIAGNKSAGGAREVGIWDNLTVDANTTTKSLKIGNWVISQDGGGHLEFKNGANKVAFGSDGNIWEGKNKRWLSDAVDTSSNYAIQSQRNKHHLQNHDKKVYATYTAANTGAWEMFKFIKK